MEKIHTHSVRVYYENTDTGGIVYHADYLGFAERARTEMLRAHGFEHAQLLKETGVAFAIRHIDIDYKRSSVLDDMLDIETTLTRMGGASFDMKQVFKHNGEAIVEMKVVLVCMDTTSLSATRIPEYLRTLFGKLLIDKTKEVINV